MSAPAASRLARGIAAVTVSGVIAAVVLGVLSGYAFEFGDEGPLETAVIGIVGVTFAIIGALVAHRHPRNPVAWILCLLGASVAVVLFCGAYATYALLAHPGSLPGGEAALWLHEWAFVGTMPGGNFLLLLFPNGRLLSRRWRLVAWIACAGMTGVALHEAFSLGPVGGFPLENPLGLGGVGGQVAQALAISYTLVILSIIASVASLAVRLRRSSGDERQQLKWLATGGAMLFVGVVASNVPGGPGLLAILLGQMALAAAVGIAILRHRLYDIDVVINGTLVYGALTASLAAAYLGSVLLLQLALNPLTASSNLAIAGSTLAVAALFQPARRRIQAIVDRRFYRRKYDAARTLERFGAQLRDEVDLDALGDELRAVVAETMQPAHVTLWLRAPQPGRSRNVARTPGREAASR